MTNLPDAAEVGLAEPVGPQQSVAEKQQALDRQIESWNAFHAEHGLLSDEFSTL